MCFAYNENMRVCFANDTGGLLTILVAGLHALCMRDRHWPALNRFSTASLHRDLLPTDADRPCRTELDATPSRLLSQQHHQHIIKCLRIALGKEVGDS